MVSLRSYRETEVTEVPDLKNEATKLTERTKKMQWGCDEVRFLW